MGAGLLAMRAARCSSITEVLLSRASPLPQGNLSDGYRRNRLDLKQHLIQRQARHRNQGTGRCRQLAPYPLHLGAQNLQTLQAVINDQYGDLGHVLDLRIRRCQGDLQVGKGLADLLGKVAGQLAVGVLAALAGGVHQTHIRCHTGNMGVTIGRRVIQPCGVEQ